MARYRKKPVVIEAMQYHKSNISDILDFIEQLSGKPSNETICYDPEKNEYFIKTLEGNLYASDGDFIIQGIQGEFYPCKPDIFMATYEGVE